MYEKDYTITEHIKRSYDVVVLGIAYLIFGLASSYLLNYFSWTAYPTDPKIKLAMEIILEVSVTVLFSYFIHIIITKLPLPMIGSKTTQEQIIREVRGGIVIAFAMLTLQIKLRLKIQYLFYSNLEFNDMIDIMT